MNQRSFMKAAAATAAAAVLGLGRKADEMAVRLGRGLSMLLDREGIKASDVKRRIEAIEDGTQGGYLVPPNLAEDLLEAVAEQRDIPGARYILRMDEYGLRIIKKS